MKISSLRTFRRGTIDRVVGCQGLNQFMEGPDEVVIAQPVVDDVALFARADQVHF